MKVAATSLRRFDCTSTTEIGLEVDLDDVGVRRQEDASAGYTRVGLQLGFAVAALTVTTPPRPKACTWTTSKVDADADASAHRESRR